MAKYEPKRDDKKCGVCGKEFRDKPNKKYCSPECAKAMQLKQLKALQENRATCPHCHKEIPTPSGRPRVRRKKEKVGA
jgi:hypothetical protein